MQDGDQAIIVTYQLPDLIFGLYAAGFLEERPAWEANPTLYPGEGGGEVYQVTQLPLILHCSSEDGVATAVAAEIKTTDDGYGPTLFNWTTAEYSALVYQRADGTYAIHNDNIYSIGQLGKSTTPHTGAERVIGIIHNHPDALGGESIDLIQRYPGEGDWKALTFLQSRNYAPSLQFDMSMWILDRWGVVRRFKQSEKVSLEALDDSDRNAGSLLEGREVTTPCQPQP